MIEPEKPVSGQRQQPKRKKRSRPAPAAGTKPPAKPGTGTAPSANRSTTGGDTTRPVGTSEPATDATAR